MSRFALRFLPVLVLACVGYAALTSAAPVPKIAPLSKDNKEAKGDAIRKTLDATVTLEYNQVTLAAVLTQLSEAHKVPFVLDKNVLNQMGFDDNQLMIETKQKDVKLRSGLRNILNQYGLTLAIIDDHVFITSEEVALYKQFKQRINLDYNEVPLSKIFKEISQQYGVNIVLDPKCVKAKTTEAPVTLQLEEVAFDAAVRLLCEMGGLKAARLSNVVYITTEERADKLNKDTELMPNPNPNSVYPGSNPNTVPGLGVVPPANAAPAPPAN